MAFADPTGTLPGQYVPNAGNQAGQSTSHGDHVGDDHSGQSTSHGDHVGKAVDPTTDQSKSAKALLLDMLDSWGLGALAKSMWHEYLTGAPDQKILSDIRASDAYKQRFPGMDALRQSGHAISESDYINKETADISLLHAYGVDSLAGNRQVLGNLIANQVSTTELQSRLDTYQRVVVQLPHEVRDYLAGEGVHQGDLIGYWLNPDQALPELQQKAAAAEVGGAAQLSGFGSLDPAQAVRLAGMGVNFQQAMTGFEKAGELKGLTQSLPGQAGAVSSQNLTDALLADDSSAALKVQHEQARRKAQFAAGGQVVTTQEGAVGLGTADQ